MPYVTTEVDVWVDASDIIGDARDIDLRYELENRGYRVIEDSDEERTERLNEALLHNELFKLSRTLETRKSRKLHCGSSFKIPAIPSAAAATKLFLS